MEGLKKLSPGFIKKKQYMVLTGVILGFIAISTAIILLDEAQDDKKDSKALKQSEKRIELSKIAGGIKDQDRWLQKAEGELKKISQGLESNQSDAELLKAKITQLENTLKQKEEEQSSIDMLAAEVGRLREELESVRESQASQPQTQANSTESQLIADDRKIQHYEIKLNNSKSELRSYDLKNFLPPNSYAKAVVVESADTSVGINSQSEPRNMMFRVIGKAKGAVFNGKIQETDIEGCIINGGVAGDLSSERGYIRLVTMNCSREEGKSIITPIKGHVSSIGKAGIRGTVISREGDFIFKSFLAGIAGGAGNTMSQKFASPMALPSGLATQQPSTQDILSSGLGKGISNSSNTLEGYLIKRAEQYQPIISLPVGIEVELVFIDGVYLDGRPESEEKKNEK